jgi:sec-independent protein translocase protein TatA
MNLGPTELVLILVIVIILFGVGRVGRLGEELGTAVRAFRNSVGEPETEIAVAEDD